MITITQLDFSRELPFVSTATDDLYDSVAQDFTDTFSSLTVAALSPAVAEALPAVIEPSVRQFVITDAFLGKIHSRDVILTDTGFGIVSNQNIAPASQQRVEAARKEISFRRDRALERIVDLCRRVSGWADTIQAEVQIPTLLWNPTLLAANTAQTSWPSYEDLRKATPAIVDAETKLRRMLGEALMEQLLAEERRALLKEERFRAVQLMRRYIGAVIDDRHDAQRRYALLANFIEQHIDRFPEYRDSRAYTANHHQGYENKKDDPTFFFG